MLNILTSFKICNRKPKEVYALRQDGSLIPSRKSVDENSSNHRAIGGEVLGHSSLTNAENIHAPPTSAPSSSPRTFRMSTNAAAGTSLNANGSAVNSTTSQRPSSPAAVRPSPMIRNAARSNAKQKREVQVIEFDEDDHPDDEPEPTGESSSKRINDTVFVYPVSGINGCSVHLPDLKYLDRNLMLNDTIIDFYLKYILYELVDEQMRAKFHMFNSFFYTKLSQAPTYGRPNVSAATRAKRVQTNYQTIRSWTKKTNLFEKDYIIVPINEDIHWYLAIVINPKAGIITPANGRQSTSRSPSLAIGPVLRNSGSTNTPFVVIFDSLIDPCEAKHSTVQQNIAEYLSLEYNDKKEEYKLPGTGFNKSSLKVINPKGTPQQKNYVDCGVFLLQFAELFMTNPPKKLSQRASFLDWYPNFQIKRKRDEIKSCIRRLAPEIKFSDFLPEPVKRKSKRGKKAPPPIETAQPQVRRHSTSSIYTMEKEEQFISSLSHGRSYDSVLEAMRGVPPLVITMQDILRQRDLSDI